MSRIVQLFATMTLTRCAMGATLIASHFSGGLYTLSLTGANDSGTLAITSQATGCGMPGWTEFYSDSRQLYCFDESWFGSGSIVEYSVANDGRLSVTSQAKTGGNSVHGVLFGGEDGRSFVGTAEL
jgi:6-phosphogluconolactonase (cycloisomerase 2 family)